MVEEPLLERSFTQQLIGVSQGLRFPDMPFGLDIEDYPPPRVWTA